MSEFDKELLDFYIDIASKYSELTNKLIKIIKEQNSKIKEAIDLINEYANGGFYYIMKMMQDQSITNDLEWVKQEIFGR